MRDALIGRFDRALRTVAGVHTARRQTPGEESFAEQIPDDQRRHAAALMRVNHVGEVCAQALYEGQALVARDSGAREALQEAAREEEDHLAWCSERIQELGGRTSFLNPVWYAGSLALGVTAGVLGDRWSLAFLAETERQVESHLQGHLDQLPAEDTRTRAIVAEMQKDESRHRATAMSLGAAELPQLIKAGMRLMSKVMTTLAYRV